MKTLILEHLIDCDANPYIPCGCDVKEHKKGGLIKFNLKNISLYLSRRQKKGGVSGDSLRTELANKNALNANVLDYLLAHQELIPKSWKGKSIFFWGTIYYFYSSKFSRHLPCVRCLFWSSSSSQWLEYMEFVSYANDRRRYFVANEPAAIKNKIKS
jgi:hypothetical protein